MSCSVHVQFPAGKPVTVSVNGVAIARDAIQREMQHHPAEKPIAAWQQAARALVIRELLLQRAKHLGLPPEPICDEAGRRETDDEALMRAVVEREVTVPDAGRRDLPALLRAKQRALPIARYLRGVAYPVCSAAGRPGKAMQRRARMPPPSSPRFRMIRIALRCWRRPIRNVLRRSRAAISARSPAGRPLPNSSTHSLRSHRARSAPSQWRPAMASTSSGSSARSTVACCPMKWLQSILPTICVKASSAAPMRNMLPGWRQAARIEGIELASAEALRVH